MARYEGYPKVEVPERWNGCVLVNPLCPDDLCWLPAVNGKQHRLHCLGTDRWDERFTVGGTAFYMSKISTTQEDLITEGWQKQLQMSPHEEAFRREVWGSRFVDWLKAWTPDSPPFDGIEHRQRRGHWRRTAKGRVWVQANHDRPTPAT
jgi:hypothetical protein